MTRQQLIALFLTVHFAWAGWISLAVIDIKTTLAEMKVPNQKATNEQDNTNTVFALRVPNGMRDAKP